MADPGTERRSGSVQFITRSCITHRMGPTCTQEKGSIPGSFDQPIGVTTLPSPFLELAVTDAVGSTGSVVSVDREGNRVPMASGDGLVRPTGVAFSPATLSAPLEVLVADPAALDGTGTVLAVNPRSGRRRVVSSGGSFVTPSWVAVELPRCGPRLRTLSFPGLRLRGWIPGHLGTDDDDVIRSSGGITDIAGLDGADRILMGPDEDWACGGGGADEIDGADGTDLLYGEGGSDVVTGGAARDELAGGDGSDQLNGGPGRDRISGGKDDDRLKAGDRSDAPPGAPSFLWGRMYGGPGKDVITGDAGKNALYGEAGPDRLVGGRGRDSLVGGAGSDTLLARDGRRDSLISCGPGRDKVIADRRDRVSRNCEQTRLRPAKK